MVTHQTHSPEAALPLPPRRESLRLSARADRKTNFYSRPLCRKGLAFVVAATEAAAACCPEALGRRAELSLFFAVVNKGGGERMVEPYEDCSLRFG